MPLIGESVISNFFGSYSSNSATIQIFNGVPAAIMVKNVLTNVQGDFDTLGVQETDNAVSILNITHRNDDGSDTLIPFGLTGSPTQQTAVFDLAMVQVTISIWTVGGYTTVDSSLGFWA